MQFQHTTDVGKRKCTSGHGGTSAAAPLAVGVFALALEARYVSDPRAALHVLTSHSALTGLNSAGVMYNICASTQRSNSTLMTPTGRRHRKAVSTATNMVSVLLMRTGSLRQLRLGPWLNPKRGLRCLKSNSPTPR